MPLSSNKAFPVCPDIGERGCIAQVSRGVCQSEQEAFHFISNAFDCSLSRSIRWLAKKQPRYIDRHLRGAALYDTDKGEYYRKLLKRHTDSLISLNSVLSKRNGQTV